MNNETEKPAEPILQCSVCLKEIPASLAKSEEAQDYVYYFCGDDCYHRWEKAGKPEVRNNKE